MDHYCQSVNTNGKLAFKISAVFKSSDSLDITIFKDEAAWNANMSKDELTEQSNKHQISFDKHYANLRKYIQCCPEDTEFEFKSGKFSVNVLLKNKMKMSYFQCQLIKVNFIGAVYGVLDNLYDSKLEYYKELSDISNKHTILKNDYKIMEMKLNEFLERRECNERKLCNKFTLILNEKKRQIRHLNDLLIAFRQGRSTVNLPVQVKRKWSSQQPKNKQNTKIVPNSSESEPGSDSNSNNDNYDTDEAEHSNDNNIPSAIPSTSRLKNDLLYPSLPETPPESFTIAKRICKDNNAKVDKIAPRKESAVDQKHKDTLQEQGKWNIEEVPKVDFNTQDMLDNL